MRGLQDKVVVITGAAQGIGRATARAFLDQGSKVVIADIDDDAGRRALQEITDTERAMYVHTDVADEASIQEMVRATVESFGQIDALVNNAAVFIMRGLDATVEEWHTILAVNVVGYALCAKHAVPEMIKRGGGSIVNVASVSSFIAQPGYLTYNTSKGAVANMTRCMALDLAPHRIRVNAVCPGTVWTERTERYISATFGLDRQGADAHPEIGGVHMLGRTADPREIAAAIIFLTSDEASFITAENLMVDGGYSAK